MTNPHPQTNGASLEDCHTNFFSLTDVCGIKWTVWRASDSNAGSSGHNGDQPLEDPVLASFALCLEAGLLAVWRRVPRRCLVDYSFDNAGNQVKQPKSGHDDKNQLSQCKELWLFWYGEKPTEQLRTLVSDSLKEITDSSGSWEAGIPYEARTLLFKALNNLIERNLLSREFVRIGKWFVQPYDGGDHQRPGSKSSHLSFSFSYFIHGESAVCTSIDVRQHPPVRRLNHAHIAAANSLSATIHVVLAPYGMAATLTGTSYTGEKNEEEVRQLLEEWRSFWPLTANSYVAKDAAGKLSPMPEAVEVLVSGVRLVYPTSYVLVTDEDNLAAMQLPSHTPPLYSFERSASVSDSSLEPSPFTASNHQLLAAFHQDPSLRLNNRVWTDSLLANTGPSNNCDVDGDQSGGSSSVGSVSSGRLSNWNYSMPARSLKPRSRIKSASGGRDRIKEHHQRVRFNARHPFHRRKKGALAEPSGGGGVGGEGGEELGWTLDQDGLHSAAAAGRLPSLPPAAAGSQSGSNSNAGGGSGGPGSVPRNSDGHLLLPLQSPASVGGGGGGPVTPRPGGPDSVRSNAGGDSSGTNLPSLAQPSPSQPLTSSSGPPTPFDALLHPKTPGTPAASSSEHGPRSQQAPSSVPSPYHNRPVSRCSGLAGGDVKMELTESVVGGGLVKAEPLQESGSTTGVDHDLSGKRPALPAKEYEEEEEEQGDKLQSVYDYKLLNAWLSHPVKKFKGHDSRLSEPTRRIYRRKSQSELFAPILVDTSTTAMVLSAATVPAASTTVTVDGDNKPANGGVGDRTILSNGDINLKPGGPASAATNIDADADKKDGGQKVVEDENLFSTDGLKPSIHDLDNIFEDSDNELNNLDGTLAVPTPPSSVKDIDSMVMTKLNSKPPVDLTGNLPADQLHQMFPTPPSHEHPNMASPADMADNDIHYGSAIQVKSEPRSPSSYQQHEQHPQHEDWAEEEELNTMLASSKFAPLPQLYSDTLPPLDVPSYAVWKGRPQKQPPDFAADGHSAVPTSVSHPSANVPPSAGSSAHLPHSSSSYYLVSSSSCRPGLSPISPAPSGGGDGGPRSHGGPGSVGGPPSVGGSGPRSVGPLPSPHHHHHQQNQPHNHQGGGGPQQHHPHHHHSMHNHSGVRSVAPPPPTANSLTVNLVLSDSLLNLYRDINFNSCTMCVCTNEGNIRGGESLLYLPDINSDEDYDCKCGYSAVVNRKLSYLAGMFLEDEREATGMQEDVYYKKKPSLLLLDPKSQEHGEQIFKERAAVVDEIPHRLVELLQQQVSMMPSEHSSVVRYSQQYSRSVAAQPPQISVVEALDGAEVVWLALETVRASSSSNEEEPGSRQEQQLATNKASCLHKWPLMPTPGPFCSEDIVRVMKSLAPLLNSSLHGKRTSNKDTQLSVEGPLTWRQFHRMAGVTTKGNTDDGCEPLPIPTLTLGYEREWLSVSPFALYYWDTLCLEPWAPPRDIAYIILAPDSEVLLDSVKTYFKSLSNTYSALKLGKHCPITKTLRDGILRVGSSLASKLESEPEVDEWFQCIGDSQNSDLLKLYAKVCHHYLVPILSQLPHDASLLKTQAAAGSSTATAPTPAAPPLSSTSTSSYNNSSSMSNTPGGPSPGGDAASQPGEEGGENKENLPEPIAEEESSEPPAIVIYMIDPFSYGNDNMDLVRLSSIGLLRCFEQMVPSLSSETMRKSLYLQTLSLDSIFAVSSEMSRNQLESNPLQSTPRASHILRGLALSVYTQSQRPLSFNNSTKTLTGFGPGSTTERFLRGLDKKQEKYLKQLYCPPYVLAPPSCKNKKSDGDSFGSSNERSSVLFVNYCLSDDQRHLLASLSDDRGELVKTTVININIPNRTRRKKASARRVGLSRLWDWILSVMALSLVPWRLVIGRLGRIGHGELRGWSVLLTRRSLKMAVKHLKEECPWKSDVPTILSVCLVSMEPDGVLRVMSDQYTPDERFGGSAAQCTLSTPRDATATHILVFPTSATAQSAQAAFNDHQEASANDDLGFGLDMADIDDMNPNGTDDGLGLGDLNDIFNDEPFTSGGGNSPGDAREGDGCSNPNTPHSGQLPGQDPAFRYGQEEPGERLEILQQPLALGYLTSTAQTGTMPRWFWSSAPHLENVCPVFLRSALHINIANLAHGGDDGFPPQAATSGRVHSLDSNYTTDVLRYVLEGYNALSWLVLDPLTHDRKSCLPIHVQALLQLYHAMSALT